MKFTNKKGLNEAFTKAMGAKGWYGGEGEERYASATELVSPLKPFLLKKRHYDEIEEDFSERIFMLLGSAVHSILEKANDIPVIDNMKSNVAKFFEHLSDKKIDADADLTTTFIKYLMVGANGSDTVINNNVFNEFLKRQLRVLTDSRYITEKRLKVKIGDYTVSGGFDLYDKETRTIEDYKTLPVWAYIYRNQEGSRIREFTEQLNIYKLFMELNGYKVDRLQVNMVFRDYQKSKAAIDDTYPDPVETIELEMWDNDTIKGFILEKLNEIERYMHVADDDIPVCSALERWEGKSQWQVFKNANKRSTKNFYSYYDAKNFIAELNDFKNKYTINELKGKPKRCLSYCSVNKWCNFYQNYIMTQADEKLLNEPEPQLQQELDL